MEVINIHEREINQSKAKVFRLLGALSTKEDKIWPYENWPAIRFKNGLKVGSVGGHGPIKYSITNFNYNEGIVFKFITEGFNGTHSFKINELNTSKVEVRHTIKMKTSGLATFSWIFVIRWLHDALIEDAFDKLENLYSSEKKETKHSSWVKFLRNRNNNKCEKAKNISN